jgi:hypothetical protein
MKVRDGAGESEANLGSSFFSFFFFCKALL